MGNKKSKDPWEDDPEGFRNDQGGTWLRLKNVDMSAWSGQVDVTIIKNWKKKHTIRELKRMVEERGYSAFTVSDGSPSFGHAALKNFDYELLPEHCTPISETHRHPCSIFIYQPPQHLRKPPAPNRLVLATFKHQSNQLGFPQLEGQDFVPLELSSHPGLCVAKAHTDVRTFQEWQYMELCITDTATATAQGLIVRAKWNGQYVISEDGFVLDISFWKYTENNTVNLVRHAGGQEKKTFTGGGGRDFVQNENGTITPSKAKHFFLGSQFAPVAPSVPVAQVVRVVPNGKGAAFNY